MSLDVKSSKSIIRAYMPVAEGITKQAAPSLFYVNVKRWAGLAIGDHETRHLKLYAMWCFDMYKHLDAVLTRRHMNAFKTYE